MQDEWDKSGIAIIGMCARFPGAPDTDAFWQNLRNGIESVHHFSDDELRAVGIDQAVLDDPDYVKAAAFLDDPDAFDAAFFGQSHREAEITDPQHRVLLECAWTALEDAGYNPRTFPGAIGVYAGANISTYLLANLASNPAVLDSCTPLQLMLANANDFLSTRIAYKLNLRGPSYAIGCACSTSLVAVHIACESLLNEECDMALAGGVSINVGLRYGYRYLEGGMASPDGRCRPFDAKAQGTIFGSGAGLVVLKRLGEALADGDTIHAIIKGSAINNDGSLKVGYTAPSVDGQAQVIVEALARAGVSPASLSYIETHGTATPLGDPIEIQALTKAFRVHASAPHSCPIGSVKSNIGHLDAAAGIAGLIKTVLALEHKQLPPSLHFEQPNPNINFKDSPFYVNTALTDWPSDGGLRYAGVSSFGIGGTNAHVILQEASPQQPAVPTRPPQLLSLSAKTETALTQMTANLADHMQKHSELNLADVAYTLQVGREAFSHRRFVLAHSVLDAIDALHHLERQFAGTWTEIGKKRPIAFMFPGQGAQYVNMGRDLYEHEPVFRQEVDRGATALQHELGFDLRDVLYPDTTGEAEATERLQQTAVTQPALFVIEYALAQMWQSWGIRPQALVGHSIGEYVAACLAGVFTLQDALSLVAARGRLMQSLPGGVMLAVPLPESELAPLLSDDLAVAAVNGPSRCVVSGPRAAVDQLERWLVDDGVSVRRLHTSHAFHSPMMDPILAPFTELVSRIKLQPPQTPYLSNVSGKWVTAEEATNPEYWARHLRRTVRMADNLAQLLADKDRVLLELGPGETLCSLARQHPHFQPGHAIVSALRHARDAQDDVAVARMAVGRLWLAGAEPDWTRLHGKERPRRVPLPSYPFAKERYWIQASGRNAAAPVAAPTPDKQTDVATWFYIPTWQRMLSDTLDRDELAAQSRRWLLFADEQGVADELAQTLAVLRQSVSIVRAGTGFQREGRVYAINPESRGDYDALVSALREAGQLPDKLLHLWNITDPASPPLLTQAQTLGYYSLLYWVQAMMQAEVEHAVDLVVVANQLFALTGQEVHSPEKATLLGMCKVIPQEYENAHCQVLDIGTPQAGASEAVTTQILAAALHPAQTDIAYRGSQCWKQIYQPLSATPTRTCRLRKNGVYLLTGGLDDIGMDLAQHLAQTWQARLAMIEEPSFPPASAWDGWLATHSSNHPISQKILQARALADCGGQVLVVNAQLTDEAQVQDVVERVTAHWGPIHGVIHNASSSGKWPYLTIADTGPEESAEQFAPRVQGTINLARALAGRPLDFCLLNSSLASVLGTVGTGAYTAANRFMEAFAQQQHQMHGGIWTSVNWDAWENSQMTTMSAELARVAITRDEGIAIFERVLGLGIEQVIISTVNLAARSAQGQDRRQPSRADGIAKTASRPRPDLPTPYVPPGNEREHIVAEIWQQAFGIERVGVLDNFFELGGDSLMAIQMVARLKRALQVDVPVVSLYEGLTIRSLVGLLDAARQTRPEEGGVTSATQREAHAPRRREIQQQQRARRSERRHSE